jgi:high-affinity iron transporter
MTRWTLHLSPSAAWLIVLIVFASIGTSQAASREEVLPILQMIDYVGVDYPTFVQDGQVKNPAEYAEQREFSADIRRRLAALPETTGKAALMDLAAEMESAVDDKSTGARVQALTAHLTQLLLSNYPVTISPSQAPDPAVGARVYQQQCAGCHGAEGHGDGPAAAGLSPAPTDFHNLQRRNQRSLLSYYNTLTLGVTGTPMASYSRLSESERWALAFHIGQLAFTTEQRQAGAALWAQDPAARKAIPDLASLVQTTPLALSSTYPGNAQALMAALLANPGLFNPSQAQSLSTAHERLETARSAYRAGDREAAGRAALSAYLDGFELAEAALAASDRALMSQIEADMMALRGAIRDGVDVTAVDSRIDHLQAALQRAEEQLATGESSATAAFGGSFLILFREGLEAILVLAAMFAFLKKSGRAEGLVYLHAGWIVALLLGFGTWFAASFLIDISGASRELTEGLTALLAAGILVGVGLWLHSKSYADRWQQYVAGQLQAAVGHGGLRAIGLVSFLAVYREAFETVLFYRAMWSQGQHHAIVLGMGLAILLLAAIATALFRFSVRLPIRQFFSFSAALIGALAVIFTGQGIAALQATGWVSVKLVSFVSIPVLGIYPTAQTLFSQILVLAVILAGIGYNHWAPQRPAAAKTPRVS